jgi:hypothetical protein
MSGVDCAQALIHLDDFLKRELTPELMAEVRLHLDRCRECFEQARFEESFLTMLELRGTRGRRRGNTDTAATPAGGSRQRRCRSGRMVCRDPLPVRGDCGMDNWSTHTIWNRLERRRSPGRFFCVQ